MTRLALLLACALTTFLAPSARSQTPPEKLDLLLPQNKERIRIEISIAPTSPLTTWNAFLDQWFAYFDTDGNGMLSRDEAARIFPLPLPDRKSVPFDFKQADADNDGKVTRPELKAFYRQAGFTPVLAVAIPTSLKNLQIAAALFRHLGPDAAGKLTVENLKHAPKLLRKLDENEDEVLTPAEVLSLSPPFEGGHSVSPPFEGGAGGVAAFQWALPITPSPHATIHLALDAAAKPMLRVTAVGKQLRADLPHRIRHEQAILTFTLSTISPAKTAANSRQFVLAQFRNIAGKTLSIEKRQLAHDPSLQVLADIFPHADRNQDGKLTLAELEQFLALIEQGVSCPLVVRLTDCGRNLFWHLDTNADGRLDLKELNAAADQMTALGGAKGWTRTQVPHYVQIALEHGYAGDSFGPLPLASPAAASTPPAAPRSAKGSAWFQAMDKNGDGFLSPREFLGPLELFQQLDRNGDGLISVEEAERAK